MSAPHGEACDFDSSVLGKDRCKCLVGHDLFIETASNPQILFMRRTPYSYTIYNSAVKKRNIFKRVLERTPE
jgi:hypothetical protein